MSQIGIYGIVIQLSIYSSVFASDSRLKRQNDVDIEQARALSGKITDENGEALPGATVAIKGISGGTITDLNGFYSLAVPDNAETLVVSFIGYKTAEINIHGQTEINVSLKVELTSLDEVVVIGYGTTKKSDLTGSISSLGNEDFNPGVVASVGDLFLGRSAGVQVIQSSAEPGGAMNIRIRGAGSVNAGNEPLYVIDGLPIDNSQLISQTGGEIPATRTPRNPLVTLNPADIESIEILKDASATAIYGARGSNGVVLITTKKGSQNKLQVNYSAYTGVQNPVRKIDLLSAQEYMSVLNAIIDEGGGTPGERVTEIQNGGTDWQDEIMQSAPVQNHNLSMSGGNETTRFYISLNYFDQEGIVQPANIQRYTARLNLEHEIPDKFKTGLNFTTAYIDNKFVSHGYQINNHAGAIYGALNFDPTLSAKDSAGNYTTSPFHTIENPLAIAYGEESNQNDYRTMGTIYGEYQIRPGWSIKFNFGGDIQTKRRDDFVTSLTSNGRGSGGIATVLSGIQGNYLTETTTQYIKDFNNHSISAVAGVTSQKFFRSTQRSYASGFAQEITKTDGIQNGNPETFSQNTSRQNSTLLSFIGRINYKLKDKYLLTTTFRADGSSRFGENHKWGYFPSVAFAWRLGDEKFMKDSDIFSDLKFRASWGLTGNQEIGNYRSLTTFRTGPVSHINGMKNSTYHPSRIGNPDLRWETTEQVNIGFDFGFVDNRIHGTVDWYNKNTSDMLLYLPVPASTGFSNVLTNIGSIKNTGFELSINSDNLVGAFKWNTSLNFNTIKNEVVDLGPIDVINHIGAGWANNIAIIRVGEPLNSFYGWNAIGVWQTGDDFSETTSPVAPGDTKYQDLNEDGSVNGDDRVILGKSFPDFTWGFANNFSYNGFNLSFFIEGVQGIQMFNSNLADSYFPVNFRRNKLAEPYLNRWTPSNPTNEYPSFTNPYGQGNKLVNSYTVEDASYIKLRNIRLGYNIPLENISILRNASIYIAGQNLVTWTKYSGFDPATNSNGEASAKIDYNSYPTAATWIVGVEIGF